MNAAHISHTVQAAEAKFQGLLESAPDAIVIVDDTGVITIVNTQTERVFGYERSEMIGQPIELLIPPTVRAHHVQQRNGYIGEPHTRPMGVGLDLLARRKDGSEFPAEISLSPLQTPEGLLVTSVIRDITDRKRAAEELERQVQQRTAHLNMLLQFSGQLLLAAELDVVLQRAIDSIMALMPTAQRAALYLYDDATAQLALRASVGFGNVPQQHIAATIGLIGRAFNTQVWQISESVDEVTAALATLPATQQHYLSTFLDLPATPTGLLIAPLVAQQAVIGVVVAVRIHGAGAFAREDRSTLEGLINLAAAAIATAHSREQAASLSVQVADLVQQQQRMSQRLSEAEAGMLQTARLAAVGQLAASVAHEINNPLYAARNCLYLIEEDLPPASRDSPYLAMARDQLSRIATIIERMRDFYRPDRGTFEQHDINRLLEETLTLAGLNARGGTIKMIFTPARDLPRVLCNGDQLRQVFLNIVLNAIEAMEGGGTLTVRTEARADSVIAAIRDTGAGIPADLRAQIFEPFFTSKSTGTGLGLAISAHIVTQHGGSIEVDSTEGVGSSFRIVLPLGIRQ